MYGGADVSTHTILTLALAQGEWSASGPGRFTPGEIAPGTHWIGAWVGPRVGVDAVEKRKLLLCGGSNLGRPTHTPSLYRAIAAPQNQLKGMLMFLNIE
jgi:hypothetical protein